MWKSPWVVGSAAGIGGLTYWANSQISTIPERHPFIQQALELVPEKRRISWYRTSVHRDDLNQSAFATLVVDGHKLRICANQKRPIRKAAASLDAHYDDFESEGSGLAFYWENPWEIKASAKRVFSNLLNYSSSLDEDDSNDSTTPWELTFVALDSEILLPSVESDNSPLLVHPDFASAYFAEQRGKNFNRAKYVLGGLICSAFFFGTKRAWTTWRMWPSYKFAQSFVVNHPSVKKFYDSEVSIISQTGNFGKNKINAEFILSGRGPSDTEPIESVVKFEASKTNTWIISHATLVP